jgi:hypothetical protein
MMTKLPAINEEERKRLEQENDRLMQEMNLYPDILKKGVYLKYPDKNLLYPTLIEDNLPKQEKKLQDEADQIDNVDLENDKKDTMVDTTLPETPVLKERDLFQPPVLNETSNTPPDNQQLDLNNLISEYAKAAREVTKRKDDLARQKAFTMLLQGAIQTASQADIKSNANEVFKDLIENADAPLFELEARDKGRAVQQKMSLADMELAMQKEAQDPNSEISKTAREQYAKTFEAIDRPELAAKIRSGTLSLQALKNLFGSLNASNMEAIYTTQQSKLEQARIRADTKQQQEEDKKRQRQIDFLNRVDNKTMKIRQGVLDGFKLRELVERALKDPNGVRDYSVLIKYVKGLDDSVVREGEAKAFKETVGYLNALKTTLSKFKVEGARVLPDAVLKQIYKEVVAMEKALARDWESYISPKRKIAEKMQLSKEEFDDIFGTKTLFKEANSDLGGSSDASQLKGSTVNKSSKTEKLDWEK